jgi:RHH-type proline utilization regulon transcriptional repressor/proline dehydrogenase/delta 1-pyrroline-5-carboxylate dehydrogenase
MPQPKLTLLELDNYFLINESTIINTLTQHATMPPEAVLSAQQKAKGLVQKVRDTRLQQRGLDAFLSQYDLSNEEGIALMCLAEALLRIPDKKTKDKLIKDKLSNANWSEHFGKSHSLFVNAATFGLMLTGKIISTHSANTLTQSLKNFMAKSSANVIRKSLQQAMKILGKQFVMGRNIQEALKNSNKYQQRGYHFSYDMLGEAAKTLDDAERYFRSYQSAIEALKNNSHGGISIKLSALHPRYEFSQADTVEDILTEKLLSLAISAKNANIGLTVDAEESERLELSLKIIGRVFADPALKNYEGFGLAVQSYQKRAFFVIDYLAQLAKAQQKKLCVRLIKGAYWDTEIKNAQVKNLSGYPVFTRKISTDVSFLACAKKIIDYGNVFYPAFATHNAYSLAAVLEMMSEKSFAIPFEFQCLHGMGYTLYDQLLQHPELTNNINIPVRVYSPVGTHEDLLAYLVRRLLENGANTSFVNRIINEKIPISDIIEDPVEILKNYSTKPHPHIPLPENIYPHQRKNAVSINLSSTTEVQALLSQLETKKAEKYTPINPQNYFPEKILETADNAYLKWEAMPVSNRADILLKTADLFEEKLAELMSLVIKEGKKTIPDALSEVREAIDFCRYYAEQAKLHLANPTTLQGPTGESNQLFLRGRGPMVCISPWNFPLAIFMGQVTAALVCGNTVIAKPASQTVHIAKRAVEILHEAGIPTDVLQLLPISGKLIGEKIISDTKIKGVIFTGSTETAQQINQILANRSGQIVPFIAETGGQNAMIVDSSALTEQVVQDVITSAFMSAGQRCSALRVLFLQENIADKTITMLKGAMDALQIGDPHLMKTDIGPVIDQSAKKTLLEHTEKFKHHPKAKLIYQMDLSKFDSTIINQDSFFAPCVFEIDSIDVLEREVFGPVLHIVRFNSEELDKVIDQINHTGYGLTMGLHSRIENTVGYIRQKINAGNIYVNRSMIGAVVGVQPFGGEGLSGTGPKAGGPHYLQRLCTERTLTINTTAAGGNASLMSLRENE